jgi:hypothetical protein
MKRTLGASNEYSAVPSKKEKMKLDSQSSDSFRDDDVADGSLEDEYSEEYEDEYEDEYAEGEEELEHEEYADDQGETKVDTRPICKYLFLFFLSTSFYIKNIF